MAISYRGEGIGSVTLLRSWAMSPEMVRSRDAVACAVVVPQPPGEQHERAGREVSYGHLWLRSLHLQGGTEHYRRVGVLRRTWVRRAGLGVEPWDEAVHRYVLFRLWQPPRTDLRCHSLTVTEASLLYAWRSAALVWQPVGCSSSTRSHRSMGSESYREHPQSALSM